jgi:hypothetical protein
MAQSLNTAFFLSEELQQQDDGDFWPAAIPL